MINLKTSVWIGCIALAVSCQEKKQVEVVQSNQNPDTVSVKNPAATPENLSPEDRISQIKNWYEDAQKGLASSNKNCKNGDEKWKAKLDEKTSMEFTNTAKICELENGIKVFSGEFNGYEYQQKFSYYFKGDQLFFVYYDSGAEACYDENRIYYDENTQPIQFLLKTNDCDGNEPKANKKIEDPKQQKALLKIVDEHMLQIKKILKMPA